MLTIELSFLISNIFLLGMLFSVIYGNYRYNKESSERWFDTLKVIVDQKYAYVDTLTARHAKVLFRMLPVLTEAQRAQLLRILEEETKNAFKEEDQEDDQTTGEDKAPSEGDNQDGLPSGHADAHQEDGKEA